MLMFGFGYSSLVSEYFAIGIIIFVFLHFAAACSLAVVLLTYILGHVSFKTTTGAKVQSCDSTA